jgi:hypothetical protein
LDRSRGSDGDMTYRLTETGLEAKRLQYEFHS